MPWLRPGRCCSAGRSPPRPPCSRASPSLAPTRDAAVARSIAAAALDPEFADLVAQADAQRDLGDWGQAEHGYWRALACYPLHAGYRVQYGHCLKEQGKLADAEVSYRSALALGAPAADLRRHIAHVHAALGAGEAGFPSPPPGPPATPLDTPPWRGDIEHLFQLLLHRPPNCRPKPCLSSRVQPSCRGVVAELLAWPEFQRANVELLVMLAETRIEAA